MSPSRRPALPALAGALLSGALLLSGSAAAQASPLPTAPEASVAAQALAISPVAVDANGKPVPVSVPKVTSAKAASSTPANAGSVGGPATASGEPGNTSIIGTDNRTRVTATTSFPSRAIVHITRNGAAHCTGWMVSRDTVVTAGHCLYNRSTASWYSGLSFTPARNGSSAPYGSATATRRITDTNYINNGDTRQDWGIVKLSRQLGSTTGWFGLKWQSASYNGTSATVRGYPGDKAFGTMWTMTGSIAQSTPNGLCYAMDTIGGQSGSPVFNSSNQGIAIHTMGTGSHGLNGCSSSYNAGTRITQSLYNLIQDEAW